MKTTKLHPVNLPLIHTLGHTGKKTLCRNSHFPIISHYHDTKQNNTGMEIWK